MALVCECLYACRQCGKKRFGTEVYDINEFITTFGWRNLVLYFLKRNVFKINDICSNIACHQDQDQSEWQPQQPQESRQQGPQQSRRSRQVLERRRIIYECHHHYFTQPNRPPSYYAELPAGPVVLPTDASGSRDIGEQ
jgi:hypothetical protein